MTVGASAVAGPGGTRGCIYVLTTEDGKGRCVTCTARITANNCEVYVNSDMLVDSAACVNADTININSQGAGRSRHADRRHEPRTGHGERGQRQPRMPVRGRHGQICTYTGCGTLKIYATITTSKTFYTVVNYRGIPSSLAISRTAQIRAQ